MKILVVDIAASSGGALSILKDYYEDAKKDSINNYVFLLSDYYLEETNNIKVIVLKKYKKWINRLIFDFFYGKKICKIEKPDEIFSLQNTIIRGTKIKQILYVHQPLPFQDVKKFSFFNKNEFKLAIIQYFIGFFIKSSIKRADSIIVQTKWMKDSIINKCNISENNISIIMPKINLLDVGVDNNISDSFTTFFYPASNVIYKNHKVILDAIKILNSKKINNFKVIFTLEGNNTEFIDYAGSMSREDVFKTYHKSVLLFPSYIETFGLPLLEARKCGTIIIASDTAFSHEILDGYNKVVFFNPFSEEELADLMISIIQKGNV